MSATNQFNIQQQHASGSTGTNAQQPSLGPQGTSTNPHLLGPQGTRGQDNQQFAGPTGTAQDSVPQMDDLGSYIATNSEIRMELEADNMPINHNPVHRPAARPLSAEQLKEAQWVKELKDSMIRDYVNAKLKSGQRAYVIEKLKTERYQHSDFSFLSVTLDKLDDSLTVHQDYLLNQCQNALRDAVIQVKQEELKHFQKVTWDSLRYEAINRASHSIKSSHQWLDEEAGEIISSLSMLIHSWEVEAKAAYQNSFSLRQGKPVSSYLEKPHSLDKPRQTSTATRSQESNAEDSELPKQRAQWKSRQKGEGRQEEGKARSQTQRQTKVQEERQGKPPKSKGEETELVKNKDRFTQTTLSRKTPQSSMVNIIGTIKLPDDILETLGKGLKYVPKSTVSPLQINTAFNQLKKGALKQLELIDDDNPNVIETFNRILNQEKKRVVKRHLKSRPKEFYRVQAALNYIKDNSLILKAADKNLGLTAMTKQWYEEQVYTHLSDNTTYTKVNEPNWDNLNKDLKHILAKHGKHRLYDELVKLDHKPAQFHIIPKIHKHPVKSRCIIPGHSHVTSMVSKFLAKKLQPIVDKYPWVINKQIDFVKEMENTRVIHEGLILGSLDVESMYTSIDLDNAVKRIKNLLAKYMHVTETEFVMDLINWVLNNNFFQYGSQWFLQTKGVAMGTSFAPQFANLYLLTYETEVFSNPNNEWKESFYRRYLDDIFVMTKNASTLFSHFNNINTWTADLRFTLEIGYIEVNFLDLTVFKGQRYSNSRILDLKLYTKPTNLYLFTDPQSNIPKTYKFGWITGEQIRYIRNNSSYGDYLDSLNNLKLHLSNRNYKENVQNKYLFLNYSVSLRNSLLTKPPDKKKPGDFIILNHDSYWKSYQRALYRARDELNKKFSKKLDVFVVVRRGNNLQDLSNRNNRKVLHAQSTAPTACSELPSHPGRIRSQHHKRQLSESSSEATLHIDVRRRTSSSVSQETEPTNH